MDMRAPDVRKKPQGVFFAAGRITGRFDGAKNDSMALIFLRDAIPCGMGVTDHVDFN
jgi:hypothetical protein